MFKTAIILAGGKSTRMGEDKAFLPFGGRPMLSRVVDELRDHFDDLILVTNQPEQHLDLEDIRLVSDVYPGAGPLGGIFSGLLASRGRHNLVVGCDYPFLNHLLLDYLWSLRTWGDVVVPLTHEALAPICAVYDRRVLPVLAEALETDERSVMGLFPRLKVHYVREDELLPYDPQLLSFRNVNTPEDYRQALSALGKAEAEAP
jgi:molybdopterin-guanine dinucleotide biosynthesis protein A